MENFDEEKPRSKFDEDDLTAQAVEKLAFVTETCVAKDFLILFK